MTDDNEYQLTPDDQLVFVHIPKTAGLTFRSILANHFDCRETYPRADEWWHVLWEDPAELAKYRLFNGHFVYGVGDLLQRPVFVTMLRDPVDRLVSQFGYIRRSPTMPIHEHIVSSEMSLDEFLTNPLTASALRDWQTGHIASVPLSELRMVQRRVVNLQAQFVDPEISRYPNVGVEVAKERLSGFAMFGICERFEDSLLLLDYTFGWKPTREFQSFNRTTERARMDELDSATLDAAAALSVDDTLLYEYATTLFDDRFTSMCDALLERYGDARQARAPFPPPRDVLLELLDRHHRRRRLETEPIAQAKFVWDMGSVVVGTGWHPAQLGPDGACFRWTGPGTTSTLEVRLAEGFDYQVEFDVRHVIDPTLLETVVLRVNGEAIALRRMHVPDGLTYVFEGAIPRAVAASSTGIVTLEWSVPRTMRPGEIDETNLDPRRVGMLVGGVRIVPAVVEETAAAEAPPVVD